MWVQNSKDIQKIADKLYTSDTYGYKFAVVIDMTKDEYPEMNDVPVYFFDNLLDELIDYIGIKAVQDAVDRRKGAAR